MNTPNFNDDFYSLINYTVYMQIKSSKKISLFELLKELAPDSSHNTLRSWIKKGRVWIDAKLAQHLHQTVEKGQEILIRSNPKFLFEDLKIFYEDRHLVVVEKPANLLSVASEKEKEQTVHNVLKRRFHRPIVYPIHRLDRETSGFLVFAYTKKARDGLKKQLEERTMHRQYLALVHGHPGKGVWRSFLRENAAMTVFPCHSSQGKEAITYFETVKKFKNHSLLKLQLETGRKHQIRVQASHAGFPIVGDQKYGIEEDKKKQLRLKAVAISFYHPILNKQMHFSQKHSQLFFLKN